MFFVYLKIGHSNSSSTSQSHHYHPSSSHINTHQSSTTGNYSQMSNGNDNISHTSYTNNTNHIAGLKKQTRNLFLNKKINFIFFVFL